MELSVYARRELIRSTPTDDRPALLLEGSWPPDGRCPVHWSLDEAIDGRFAWIDRQAADWAEQLAAAEGRHSGVSVAYLNALALRYYLVKLIRLSVYLSEVRPLRPGDRVELTADAGGGDEDYADLLRQHCRAAGAGCQVRWIEQRNPPGQAAPSNAPWRRWAARLHECLRPTTRPGDSRRRVVLCGDPRLLGPVCRELLARRCDVWWLVDRFAVRTWFRWQSAGVGQLVCDSSLGCHNRLAVDVPGRMPCGGVDLSGAVGRWLADRATRFGPGHTRLIEQIDAHFRRHGPEAVVLDQDATPMARAAVAVGRRQGVRSLVVQHGVPGCRFGFAAAAADRLLVWGRSSRRRLVDWGVPPERIRITGSLQADRLLPELDGLRRAAVRLGREEAPPRILLLATVPPRDRRPDAVALQLTRRSYTEMLRMAFAAVENVPRAELPRAELPRAELPRAELPRAELIVKLHPRSADDPVARAVAAEFPAVRCRVVRGGRLEGWLREVDSVLSCLSTAGIEATLAGVPVIQLAPPGASDALPHEQWGLAGTARRRDELEQLLAGTLAADRRPASGPDPQVFGDLARPAAERIVDEVLRADDQSAQAAIDRRRREPLAAA